jgi:pimeloyl-ACP methyl ester carboxylesterase
MQIIDTEKGRVEYSIYGKGPILFFVHGGHSNCKERLFHKGFQSDKYTLITPSRPGYGQTPLQEISSPKQTAELLHAFLEKLNIREVIVVGISAGGLTAIELAANYPSIVKKLVLISAVTERWLAKEDPNYKKSKKVFSLKVEKYTWRLLRFLFSISPIYMSKVMFKELSSFRPIQIEEDEVNELKTMISKQRSHAGFINDLDHKIEEGVLEKIVCPTLIMHSINDSSIGLKHAENAKAKIQNSLLKTYNNKWGHLLWMGKQSEKPIREATNFLNEEPI